MKTNRIIAILVTISILISIAVLPVSADDTKFKKYIIKDSFDTDLGNWAVGQGEEAAVNNMSVERVTLEGGTTALKLSRLSTSPGGFSPVANVLSDPLYFNPENKIVIRGRIKHMGNGAADPLGRLYFKINRPDAANQAVGTSHSNGNELGHDWYTAFDLEPNGFFNMKTSSWSASGLNDRLSSDSTLDKWMEFEMVFSGGESYTISVTEEGGATYNSTGTISQPAYLKNEVYIPYTYYFYGADVDPVTAFERFDSFTFLLRDAVDTAYIDYFEVYEEKDYTTATAGLEVNYIRTTDSLTLAFASDEDIDVIPEGAVYIDGVDADVTYDKATKKVTLKPKSELTPGAHHIIKVNAALLAEKEGINYEGPADFAFDVSDVNVSALAPVGRVIPGTTVTATYTYTSPVAEGNHIYQWQQSVTIDGVFSNINGATSKDLVITNDQVGKYLRFTMIPVDANGTQGFVTTSSVLAPEVAPIADNVEISTTTLFSGIYISALYDYSDENGDKEGETDVRWYTSDSADSTQWTEVKVGKTYFIENLDAGKYIKCSVTPIAVSQIETRGQTVESPVVGPVVDLLETTNMYVDSSFEMGRWQEPWEHSKTYGWIGPDVHSKDAYTGTYSVHMPPRASVHDYYGQPINYTKGKTYVLGAWAKKSNPKDQDITGVSLYMPSTTAFEGAPSNLDLYTLNERWQHIVFATTCLISTSNTASFVTYQALTTGDAYLDDYYCGELLVGDIHTYDIEPVTVPTSGETKLTITNGQVLNQLGTKHGLENEKLVVSIPEIEGVYLDTDNNIVVTDKAHSTKFTAELYCEPKYEGATQAKFQKFVEIEINAHDDPKPKAVDVDASGTVAEGATLTGTYSFYQVNNEIDASEIRWMYSDSENGVYYDIPGANSLSYTVQSQYADKYIKFAVVPKSESGLVGDEVRSVSLTKPRAPFASNVEIKGVGKVGTEITGEYTYTDPNRDTEGTSIYKWYTSDELYGPYSVIDGQNGKTLNVTAELINKYIKFGVTPVSTLAPETGVEVLSEAIIGPVPPQATEVSIRKDGYRLQGVYKYYHPNGIKESGSVYSWLVDGVTVSNEADYVINFNGTKTVTFKVTPVCNSEPKYGEAVSVSVVVTGHAETSGGNTSAGGTGGGFGGGSSGGGLSGGSGSGAGVTSVNDMKIPEPEVQKPQEEQKPKTDITGHWGETYINNMASRGVMKADESGNFDPDKTVARFEMIEYLFDALKLEETQYSAEFSDVSSNESYAGKLQTMINNGTIATYHEFRPNDGISREEMCKILYISLENAGKLKKAETNVLDAFTDKDLISDWATDYVNTIYANKIMIGTSDTTFAPKENITRAQVATMLVRILEVIEKEAE